MAVDLSGSGMSDGEYISLGVYEKEDVVCIVKHLREEGKTSKVFILFICNLKFFTFLLPRLRFGVEAWEPLLL